MALTTLPQGLKAPSLRMLIITRFDARGIFAQNAALVERNLLPVVGPARLHGTEPTDTLIGRDSNDRIGAKDRAFSHL